MKKADLKATTPAAEQVGSGRTSHTGSTRPAGDAPSQLAGVVAEIREGDGVDPRDEAKRKVQARRTGPPGRDRGAHRKERFAAQVGEAIEAALQLAEEPLLNALTVREVAQQGGSLLVVTEPRNSDLPFDVAAATRAIKKAGPMLTREVAREITRKETPILSFIVLPAGAERLES